MCTGTHFPVWQARSIASLLALDGVTVELLVVDQERTDARAGTRLERLPLRLRRLVRRPGRLWGAYERLVRRGSPAERSIDLSGLLRDVPVINCQPIRRGRYSQYFSPADVEAIRDFRLDFVLRFAFDIIRGDILTAARYGIWSFHHGDERSFRGRPAGFWEIYNREPVTGAILQRLTDRLDAGIVLRRGHFATIADSWIRNRDQVRLGTTGWPARVCEDIRSGVAASYIDAEPSTTTAPIFRRPSPSQLARVLGRVAIARVTPGRQRVAAATRRSPR